MSLNNDEDFNDLYTKDKYYNDVHESIDTFNKDLDFLKVSIKNSDDINEQIKFKAQIEECKKNLKNKKIEFKDKYNKYLIPLKNKDILLSSDGKHHENKYKNLTKKDIIFYKKLVKEYKKQKPKKIKDKYQDTINKFDYKIHLNEIKEKYSYNAILNKEILQEKKDYFINKNLLITNYKKNLKIENNKFNNNLKNKKNIIKPKLKENFLIFIKSLFKLINKRILFKIKKTTFRNEYLKIKEDYFMNKNNLINNNEYYLWKMNIKYIKDKHKKELKNIKFNLVNKIDNHINETPIIWSKHKKWIAGLLSLFIPGLGQLYSGQFKKALIYLFITPLFLLMLLYSFGIGNIEGQGIIGLITLGRADNLWETKDARYFVIEGSLSVIFIAMLISYCLFSALSIFKQNILMEFGIRKNSWLETKNYLLNNGYPIITSIPCILSLIFISFIPIITSILLAFTNYGPTNSTNFKWSGLEQFKILLDKDWSKSLFYVTGWTLLWTFFSWFTSFVIAYILAIISNHSKIKFKKLFRIIYILPWAIPAFISILIFRLMTIPGGLISNWLGIGTIQSNVVLARIAILFIQMWMGYCVNFVLITGILQSINNEMYEAVEIDGGGIWQKTFKITLPIIIYQMTPILIGQLIGCFNNFVIIYLYLDGGPYLIDSKLTGGAGATDTISSLIFKLISRGHVAKASALNIVVSAVIVAISVAVLVRSKSIKGGQN